MSYCNKNGFFKKKDLKLIVVLKVIRWMIRIFALVIVLFGLPFYFGYGNPIPFTNPSYKLYDNLWLVIFPLMFIGLILGWKNEKIGGFLITIPILIGFTISMLLGQGIAIHMLIPLSIGILYLITGHRK